VKKLNFRGHVGHKKYVHVAVGALFAARIGTEEPSLQDGLRLEVLGYLLRHYLCGHI
jgi:hypothetical protein